MYLIIYCKLKDMKKTTPETLFVPEVKNLQRSSRCSSLSTQKDVNFQLLWPVSSNSLTHSMDRKEETEFCAICNSLSIKKVLNFKSFSLTFTDFELNSYITC